MSINISTFIQRAGIRIQGISTLEITFSSMPRDTVKFREKILSTQRESVFDLQVLLKSPTLQADVEHGKHFPSANSAGEGETS
jgi:hypothetical protein